ncbi:FAD-binding oxidoreductase [Rhodovastum atsumiense]|uniref:FAD-binding oxidoreductase n=1 Tax=Rhodovastum atsumiense TaxID=504468 RepID=A0A5M6J0G2_9PROT|nr:FAD-dependent oxidoreductase [Rhodovastum atsumiense]KAA5614096.1 FAD-binding oxidoreductase [Rhodovastum atsumiense]CAH2598928.1 FAD-binding oxidoreductase [Rhodovastum atsumiense]
MTSSSPIAVVGAGVVGVACARALQRAGRQVVLFDPAPPGSLTSSGNAGHIALDHIRPLARPDVLAGVPRMLTTPLGPLTLRWRGVPALSPWFARFAAAALPARVTAGTTALAALLGTALPDWKAELQTAGLSDMLRRQGTLTVIETPGRLAAARAEGRLLASHGVAFRDLSGAEVMAEMPGLARVPAGGRLFPTAAHVLDPFGLVQALAARFVADGGTLVAAPVTGFRRGEGRITAVVTDAAEHPVDAVVLTAGLASATLGRDLGLVLPLTAERGYHAMLAPDALPVPRPTSFAERGFVITPLAHGIRLAGTVEFGADGRPPAWARADILAQHVHTLFGREVEVTERWHGDRPTLPDYLPALGAAPGHANLLVAAGHQHLGLTLAAATGRIVAALLTGTPPGLDLKPFDPGRFARRPS